MPTVPTTTPPPLSDMCVLASTDFSSYSLPRVVSADGRSVVTTENSGSVFVIKIRPTDATGPVRLVAAVDGADGPLGVGVSPDGSHVVFGSFPASTTQTITHQLHRWDAADGTISDVLTPTVSSPPDGTPLVLQPRQISADGTRILWSQTYVRSQGPRTVTLITDAVTDAVISETSVGFVTNAPLTPGDWLSVGPRAIYDSSDGSVRDIGADVDAAASDFPGPAFTPMGLSADGRYVVLGRVVLTKFDAVLRDRRSATTSPIVLGRALPAGRSPADSVAVHGVSDTGTVLVSFRDPDPATTYQVVRVEAGGAPSTISAYVWHAGTSSNPYPPAVAASPDMRTVVLTRSTSTGFQLASERCA